MCKIIFGRIADYFQMIPKDKSKNGDGIVCREQKGFAKNINGCCEHSSKIAFLISHAIFNGRMLYVAALDCKDAFGSVSHQLLDVNLKALGIPISLKNLIMDSYNETKVRIWSTVTASRSIESKKGVKQGCPLRPLLLNICVDPLISHIRQAKEFGYNTSKLGTSTNEAYADDMILIADSEDHLQILNNRAKSFFDFANIKLNPSKCEVFKVNGSKEYRNIIIDGVKKEYVSDTFVKYLVVPIGSKRICKKKFIEAKVQKFFEELDKIEYCGLAINQVIRVIRCYIVNKLYYIFANMDVPKGVPQSIDKRVRNIINRFMKGQYLQKSFIRESARIGGFGVPCMEDEYAAHKIHHIANLMSTSDGRGIMDVTSK
jgi:hypothetical protein